MGRRRRRRNHNPYLPAACAAFGLGVFLALFCSLKLALVIAAAALIYLGICYWPS